MSTIKSQTEHLTLNADGSGKEIKFQCNGTEVAKIDANGFQGDGSNLTGIDALPSGGTTDQLLTKTASGEVWADAPAGGGIRVHSTVLTNSNKSIVATQTSLIDAGLSVTITPASAKSTFLVMFSTNGHINVHTPNNGGGYAILKDGVIIDDASITEYEYASVSHHVGISVRTSKYVEHNSTSPVTFKLQVKSYHQTGANNFYWHWNSGQITIGPRLEVIEFKDGGQ